MNTVHILSTGGTFEKIYGEGLSVRDLGFPKTSTVADIISKHNLGDLALQYDSGQAKDSLDMTDADRDFIASWCNQSHRNLCVIVHGTDTMVKTAGVLAQKCSGKVIILTGALQPACMRNTDAELNLGGALVAARLCTPGVYIAMHGNVYNWDNCRKNPRTGHFEPLTTE